MINFVIDINSCFEVKPGWLDFVFNIIEIPAGSGRVEAKQGICTGINIDYFAYCLQKMCATHTHNYI